MQKGTHQTQRAPPATAGWRGDRRDERDQRRDRRRRRAGCYAEKQFVSEVRGYGIKPFLIKMSNLPV